MQNTSNIPRDHLPNPHAGEVLLEEFLKPMNLSLDALARYFGLSEGFFLGLQSDYDQLELRRDTFK